MYTIKQMISKYEIYHLLKMIKFVLRVCKILQICESSTGQSFPLSISSRTKLIFLSGHAFLRNFSSIVVGIVASGISEMGTQRINACDIVSRD